MRSRRGATSIVALATLALAGALLSWHAAEHARRARALNARVLVAQARELALGAAALAPGGSAQVGAWTLTRTADGATCSAAGPAGTYEIAGTAGRRSERFVRRQAGPGGGPTAPRRDGR